jgi:hypothetical protein
LLSKSELVAVLSEQRFGSDAAREDARAVSRADRELWHRIQGYEEALRDLPLQILRQLHEAMTSETGKTATRKLEDPDAAPDWTFWTGQPLWSLQEGVALALGKDPTRLNLRVARARNRNVEVARKFLLLHASAIQAAKEPLQHARKRAAGTAHLKVSRIRWHP